MALVGVILKLTGGNVRNNHFYVRGCEEFFPKGSIGGPNEGAVGTEFEVEFSPGEVVRTDIAGDKMILRKRGAVRDFFERIGAADGDQIRIDKISERRFKISKD